MLLGGAMLLLLGVTSALAIEYNEADMLKVKVAAGELPPVEERLPKVPLVLSSEWNEIPEGDLDFEIGQYGGTIRMVHPFTKWCGDLYIMDREPLLRAPGIGVEDIRGNILKDFEVSKDNKVFTFHMREGLKWSDGYPVTTEDVLFAYEDFLLNENLTAVFPLWLRSGNKSDGEPMKLELIDGYTFRISFAVSYGRFPVQLAIASWRSYQDLLKPKHYLKRFHIRYTSLEEMKPLLEKEKLGDQWWRLFTAKALTWVGVDDPNCIDLPTLGPWMMVECKKGITTYERNPYYFKVDEAGNQLPYIDRLRQELVSNVEMGTMKILAGEVDFMREKTALKEMPLYKENESKGGYRTVLLNQHINPTDVILNLTYPDPTWRKVVRDIRFRTALQMGINCEEIIDAIYYGSASLPTTVPSEFNLEKANGLLDEMGLDKRDAEGWRLGPGGKTFVIFFEICPHWPEIVPTTELVMEHWKALGIKTTMKTVDASLWFQDLAANKVQGIVINTSPCLWRSGAWDDYLPKTYNYKAPLWQQWQLTGGEMGEEPPAEVKRLFELNSLFTMALPGTPEDKKIGDEIFSSMYRNIFYFITAEEVKAPLIVMARLENIPHGGFVIAANYSAEQFFFKP